MHYTQIYYGNYLQLLFVISKMTGYPEEQVEEQGKILIKKFA